MTGLQRLKYHVARDPEEQGRSKPAARFRGPGEPEAMTGPFNSDEAAARFFLDKLMQADDRPSMRSAAAPDEPGTVPGMVLASQQELPGTGSHLLRFEQTSSEIPVFGGEAEFPVADVGGQGFLVEGVACTVLSVVVEPGTDPVRQDLYGGAACLRCRAGGRGRLCTRFGDCARRLPDRGLSGRRTMECRSHGCQHQHQHCRFHALPGLGTPHRTHQGLPPVVPPSTAAVARAAYSVPGGGCRVK